MRRRGRRVWGRGPARGTLAARETDLIGVYRLISVQKEAGLVTGHRGVPRPSAAGH